MTPSTQDWAERFDEKFCYVTLGAPGGYGWDLKKANPLAVRRFISSLLADERKKGRDEVLAQRGEK